MDAHSISNIKGLTATELAWVRIPLNPDETRALTLNFVLLKFF